MTTTNKQQTLRNLMATGIKNRDALLRHSGLPKFDVNRAIRMYIREGQTTVEKVARSAEVGNDIEQTCHLLGIKRITSDMRKAFVKSAVFNNNLKAVA